MDVRVNLPFCTTHRPTKEINKQYSTVYLCCKQSIVVGIIKVCKRLWGRIWIFMRRGELNGAQQEAKNKQQFVSSSKCRLQFVSK